MVGFRGDALVPAVEMGCRLAAAVGREVVLAVVEVLDVPVAVVRAVALELVVEVTLSVETLDVVAGRRAEPVIELVVVEDPRVVLRSLAGAAFATVGRVGPLVPSVETRLADPVIPVFFLSSPEVIEGPSLSEICFVLPVAPTPVRFTAEPGTGRVGGFFRLLLGCVLVPVVGVPRTVVLAVPVVAAGRRAVPVAVAGFRDAAVSVLAAGVFGCSAVFFTGASSTMVSNASGEAALVGSEVSDMFS